MQSTAYKVMASRATKCSFSSVFHLASTSSDRRTLRIAKQAEDIFIKAIIVPIGVFGGAVGVLKSCQYVCDEQLVV